MLTRGVANAHTLICNAHGDAAVLEDVIVRSMKLDHM